MRARYTYRAVIAYDGAAFRGFACQPGLTTVEGTLRRALGPMFDPLGPISVGGRTDRGVHATGQVISFYGRRAVPTATLAEAIDAVVPEVLTALEVREVSRRFHARYSAAYRRYVYLWPGEVDVVRLQRMLAALCGTRDFTAFARDTPAGRSTVRTLDLATAHAVRHQGEPAVRFDLRARSFLRRQVRVTVATALREAARGAPEDALVQLARTHDRTATEPAADPGGLYLTRVGY